MSISAIDREKSIARVTIIGAFWNFALAVIKFLAGFLGHSGAMIADAVHTLSDLCTDFIVIIFSKAAAKPKDESHDYGHGKYETLATVIIGVALFAVAISLIVDASEKIASVFRDGNSLPRPGLIAFLAAAVSIAVKEGLYQYTARYGKKLKSDAVIANAWHHRSDALSSIGTLIGIGLAYFLGDKWSVADPIAAVVVGALIIKVSFDIITPALGDLVEKSLPKDVEDEISRVIIEEHNISDLHNLCTRKIGSSIAIEFHIRMNGDMTVRESHELTRHIEEDLHKRFGDDTHIIIHVEPI